MKLTKRDGFYWVDFRLPNKVRRRKSTGIRIPADVHARGKAEAEAMTEAGRIVARESELSVPGAAKRNLTLGDILRRTLNEHWSRMAYGVTMKHVVALLERDIGHRPLDQVDYSYLKGWCEDWIKQGTSPSTVNRRMAAVGKAMREAQARKEVTEIPPRFPHYSEKAYTRERYMTYKEEVDALAWFARMAKDDEADKREVWVYMGHLTVFLIDTGFRFSEAFKFTLVGGQADLEHGCTKSTIGRRVPLTRRALAAAQFLLESPLHAELARDCVRKRDKAAWDWCSHRFDRCMLAIGANAEDTPRNKRLTMHGLRHTCASRLVQRGIDLYVVQKWMGHSSIKVTERYAKLRGDQFLAAVEMLEGGNDDSSEFTADGGAGDAVAEQPGGDERRGAASRGVAEP